MKIREILKEDGNVGSLQPDVVAALPATFELPGLKNQDPYLQYRMGLALSAARNPDKSTFSVASPFGENMSIVGYTEADIETVEVALKMIGKEYSAGATLITTRKSEEAADVNRTSPLKPQPRNRYGV